MTEPFIEFHIDTSALSRLASAAPGMTPIVNDEAQWAMKESGMALDPMVQGETPSNYGLLRSSIEWPYGFEMDGSTLDKLRGIVGASDKIPKGGGVSTSVYVDWVENGTRPHWPPSEPIELWAIRKFGISGKEAKRVSYLIRSFIAYAGTKGAHMFRNAWNRGGRAKVTRIWEKVLPKALKRWENQVRGK
jgi:hypothetical protein